MARELAGTVFPVSEAVILQTARKYDIGRKMGRCVIFSPQDCQHLYEKLPCPSGSSAAPNRLTGSSAAPSAASAFEESTGTDNKKIAEEIRAKREAEILAQSIYGRRATAAFAEAALSYLQSGGNKRFLDRAIRYFGTTPLAKINQDAIDVGARRVYPNTSPATRNRQFYTPVSAVIKHAAKRGWCLQIVLERPEKPTGECDGSRPRRLIG